MFYFQSMTWQVSIIWILREQWLDYLTTKKQKSIKFLLIFIQKKIKKYINFFFAIRVALKFRQIIPYVIFCFETHWAGSLSISFFLFNT